MADPPRPPVVVVQVAEIREFRPTFDHPGMLEARQEANLRPQVSGPIKARSVAPGSRVKKGALLFEIDDAHFRADLAEAEAALALAKANQTQADDDWRRVKNLAKGAVSERDRTQMEAKALVAGAEVARCEAQLKTAQLNLEHTRIEAPFDGKVSAANYGVGDYVNHSPPMPRPLVTLVELDPIYAIAQVDQKIYLRYKAKRVELENAGEEVPELKASLVMPDDTLYPHAGHFVNWDYSMAARRGTVAGRIEFPNPDGILLPGQNVTIHGEMIDPVRRILLPQKAVGQDQQGRYVLVVNEQGKVERRNVEVGIRHESDWTINEGVGEGERVIVEGLQKVRPGIEVGVRTAESGK